MDKNCAFQYATNPRWGSAKIIEDTGLITLEEAKELWRKYLPDFIKRLKDEDRPEMGIWINMNSDTDYSEELGHIDEDCETDGKNVWKITKTLVEI